MSIRLTLYFSNRLIGTYDFDTIPDVITIGRNPDCSIPIDNLGISRVHCQLEKSGSHLFTLVDMNSNNGTFIRGERITRCNLNDGDEFFLGKHSLRFQDLRKPQEQQASAPKKETEGFGGGTIVVSPEEMERAQRAQASKLSGYLVFTSETGIRQTRPLNKPITFFGAYEQCDFCLKGWGIQHKHALIFKDEVGQGFRLINLAPKKGILLNGEEVEDTRLENGDRFRIVKFDYQFCVGVPSF